MRRAVRRLLVAVLAPPLPALPAQSPFDSLHFRSIGPAATGGRIHDIEVDPKDPSTIYVASATGGIWKTTNKGTFWTPIFDGVPDNTFGDLAICGADPRVIKTMSQRADGLRRKKSIGIQGDDYFAFCPVKSEIQGLRFTSIFSGE